jgi:predicted transcriptional regulator
MARPGELEQQIMDILWERGELSVREVRKLLGGDLAYTTVMTVLDRLHAKEVVLRRKDGLAWRYQPRLSREQALADKIVRLVPRDLGDASPLLEAFLDRAEQLDESALDKLEALIRSRRKERKRC